MVLQDSRARSFSSHRGFRVGVRAGNSRPIAGVASGLVREQCSTA